MRRVVEREGGCIVWGGTTRISPADDVLIRVERPLSLDSEGLLVASILSKKAAVGSQQVLIDLPVGPQTKVRCAQAADRLSQSLVSVGAALGLQVRTVLTDGSQPVGRGIGPALEAIDVMAVLERMPDAPADLRERALELAGLVLEMAGRAAMGSGQAMAREVLDDGRALAKFISICDAQGAFGFRPGRRMPVVVAPARGMVQAIDTRLLARVAKLAGAPRDPSGRGHAARAPGGPGRARTAPLHLACREPGGTALCIGLHALAAAGRACRGRAMSAHPSRIVSSSTVWITQRWFADRRASSIGRPSACSDQVDGRVASTT